MSNDYRCWNRATVLQQYKLTNVIPTAKPTEFDSDYVHVCEKSSLSGWNYYVFLPTFNDISGSMTYSSKIFGYNSFIDCFAENEDDSVWIIKTNPLHANVAYWFRNESLLKIMPPCACKQLHNIAPLQYYCPNLMTLQYILKTEINIDFNKK